VKLGLPFFENNTVVMIVSLGRFSLRRMLLIVAILAGGCYFWFVRPTTIANQFISAAEKKDFAQADSLHRRKRPCGNTWLPFVVLVDGDTEYKLNAILFEREFGDVVRGRRRFVIYATPINDGSKTPIQWGTQSTLVATNLGVSASR
jgi:hypothetical protein